MSRELSTEVHSGPSGGLSADNLPGHAPGSLVQSPGASHHGRAAIEAIMRTNSRRYWRDPAMQAEYLRILEQAESGVAAEPDIAVAELAQMPTPSEWKAAGNDPAAYPVHVRLVREVNDILTSLDQPARDGLSNSFMMLPVAVHAAAFAVLGDKRAVSVEPFGEQDVRSLKQMPAYKALAREWGTDTPRKLAVLKERLWRVLDRLGDGDVRRAIRWIDNLSVPGMVALGRKLAGP